VSVGGDGDKAERSPPEALTCSLDLSRTELGLNEQAGGAYSEMADKSRPRLLDVNVRALEPDRWEWQVCDAGVPIARGSEATRETAQIKGDDALFLLLSKGTR
jgi:hypothetical protein